MKIRRMQEQDIPQVVELLVEWEHDGGLMTSSEIDKDHVGKLLEWYVTDPSFCSIVAEDDGMVVGGIWAMVTPALLNPKQTVAWQQLWCVYPAYRGGLVGPRLLAAFEVWAKGKGASRIAVGANHAFEHERVGELYVRLGYKAYETHYVKEI